MGGKIEISNETIWNGEPVGDIRVYPSPLRGVQIHGNLVPRLIDEIPIIAALASAAKGVTHISDCEELKYKESNRIKSIALGLSSLGIEVKEKNSSLIIKGVKGVGHLDGPPPCKCRTLTGGTLSAEKDHRIAMSLSILALFLGGKWHLKGAGSAKKSFPDFFEGFFSRHPEALDCLTI